MLSYPAKIHYPATLLSVHLSASLMNPIKSLILLPKVCLKLHNWAHPEVTSCSWHCMLCYLAEEVGRGNWSGGQRTFKVIWSSMSQATKSGRTGPHRMYSSRLDPKLHVIVSFCTNVLLNNCVLCSLSLLGCSSQPCCTVVIASQ